ncbi:Glycosyltransferase involved in cell wall bisynthesis [Ruminococcaceae bacterium FB2012]|nr:Glycosyltransferase involved in cell wall bisynthesis [Ruminococcaceae bacterium FB2012]
MKVLQIANGYLDKALYRNLFSQLAELDINNEIFVPVQYGDQRKSDEKNVKISRCYGKLDRLLFFPKQKKSFNSIIQHYDMKSFDLVHAHTLFSTGYIAYQIKKQFGIPYIVAIRNTDVNVFFAKQPHLRKLGLNVMKDADAIVFLSKSYAEYVIKKYVNKIDEKKIRRKISIIPNGIDDYYFVNEPPKYHYLSDPVKIIYVGDVDDNKNLITTINALELLRKKGIRTEYSVIGEVKNKRVKRYLDSYEYIKYFCKSPKEKVIKHLRDSDIFVMPSFTETFGLTYVEAMSQGLPVIYTKNQGFDGQFKNGIVGYSVNPYSPEDIAKKIVKVINRYNDISPNCIEKSKLFKWSKIAPLYKALYRREK